MYITEEQWKASDAQAKADFTASTVAYAISHGHTEEFKFYEEDNYHNLVPFGDPRASVHSRLDVYFKYGLTDYAAELKDRLKYSSTRFLAAYMNEEKIQPILDKIGEGYIVLWVELYNDGKVRIWNLNYIQNTIGLRNLNYEVSLIKEKEIDPDSPKHLQKRYLLPHELGILIDRKPGTYAN